MQRIAPVIASVVFGGLALTACGVNGTPAAVPVAYHASDVAPPTFTTVPPVAATTPPLPTTTTTTTTTTTPPRRIPVIRSGITASVHCVVADYEDLPGMAHTPLYQPKLTWHVTHATGMALSVDNPGLVGSYGTYAASGTLMLGGGCYTDGGSTTITFYSVGGAGPMVHRTIVLTPTMTRPTAPPLADSTSSS
ncbi:MAG TPA: hypothetical protein VFX16_31710 [Pseudonocardiaceae bacterium]|nr:hypothetical protein [Pseudonocardiaceae bacterium]